MPTSREPEEQLIVILETIDRPRSRRLLAVLVVYHIIEVAGTILDFIS